MGIDRKGRWKTRMREAWRERLEKKEDGRQEKMRQNKEKEEKGEAEIKIVQLRLCLHIQYTALRGSGAGGSVTRMTQSLMRRFRGKLFWMARHVCILNVSHYPGGLLKHH